MPPAAPHAPDETHPVVDPTSLTGGEVTIIHGDARNIPLPDNSVDLIITSPPYYKLRSYKDDGEHYTTQIGAEPTLKEFIDSLIVVTEECKRVLKPSGSLWVNLGDKYNAYNGNRGEGTLQRNAVRQAEATGSGLDVPEVPNKSLVGIPWRYALRCIDDLDLILRAEVIWEKTTALPESVKDRVRRNHEQWFHFTLGPRYYADIDPIRIPYAQGSKTGTHPMGRLPNSVWQINPARLRVPPELGIKHFATFPIEWPQRIIEAWCPPEGVVLDPFGGSGTTAMVAKALGRHGISLDGSTDYSRLAQWRTHDPKELAKVTGSQDHRAADARSPMVALPGL